MSKCSFFQFTIIIIIHPISTGIGIRSVVTYRIIYRFGMREEYKCVILHSVYHHLFLTQLVVIYSRKYVGRNSIVTTFGNGMMNGIIFGSNYFLSSFSVLEVEYYGVHITIRRYSKHIFLTRTEMVIRRQCSHIKFSFAIAYRECRFVRHSRTTGIISITTHIAYSIYVKYHLGSAVAINSIGSMVYLYTGVCIFIIRTFYII